MSELNMISITTDNTNEKGLSYNDDYPIIGSSEAIFRVRNQIDFSANIKFPVFITGELGTEKRSVAKEIHNRRRLPKESFINVPSNINDLQSFKIILKTCIENAKGGTLYLSEVDLLSNDLKDYLISYFTNKEFNKSLYDYDFNLILSCTNSFFYNHSEPQFIAKIFGCSVPHLEIHIPSLRERKEDISAHINYIIQKVSVRHRLSLDNVAMNLLLSYDWPENLDQLQRVLCLLASYGETDITQEDILALNLIKNTQQKDLISLIMMGEMESFEHVHAGLKKALVYISEHFTEEVSLTTLSSVACTSASHLSFLFRKHLNLSFKNILVQLRVRYAKQLIEDSSHMKITDISLQSGFGDLSHFEKMFKRYESCTPREYRQKLRLENTFHIDSELH